MMTKQYLFANWNYPTQVRFGVGRISEISSACSDLNISRPLIVTDIGLVNSQVVLNVISSIKKTGLNISLFSEVQGNPVGKNIIDGAHVYRDESFLCVRDTIPKVVKISVTGFVRS